MYFFPHDVKAVLELMPKVVEALPILGIWPNVLRQRVRVLHHVPTLRQGIRVLACEHIKNTCVFKNMARSQELKPFIRPLCSML